MKTIRTHQKLDIGMPFRDNASSLSRSLQRTTDDDVYVHMRKAVAQMLCLFGSPIVEWLIYARTLQHAPVVRGCLAVPT